MLARVVALLLALALAAGALVASLTVGRASWLIVGLLLVGAVSMAVIALRLRRKAPQAPGYVESTREFY